MPGGGERHQRARPGGTGRRRRARRTGRQRGFTLLEMLITLAVTVVGLTGLLSLHVATVKANQKTATAGEAVAVAQVALEEARNLQLDDLLALYGYASLPVDVALDTVAGRAGTTFNRRLTVEEMTAVSPELVKMRIEVTWTENGAAPGSDGGIHDHQISLEIIRTRMELL